MRSRTPGSEVQRGNARERNVHEPSISNPWKSSKKLTPRDTYFEYQRRVGHVALIPLLERHMDLTGMRVADFGCHQGGFLAALRGDGRVAAGTGFEINGSVLAASPFEPDERFHLEHRDLLAPPELEASFDLVAMCEVLEHVPVPERLLEVARRVLAPGGRVFVTFPPYWSPFGGHQHYASTFLRNVPYAHYLPEPIVIRAARIRDLPYMDADDAVADMRAVRTARLSLGRAERAFRTTGLAIQSRDLYLLRPEHVVRYGIRPRRLPFAVKMRGVAEIVAMGAYYVLRAADG